MDYKPFDAVYIINLRSRPDRRAAMERELERSNFANFARQVEFLEAVKPTEAAGFPNPGVRGNFLSHLQVLTRARDRHLYNVVVMEDDLAMPPDLEARLGEVLLRLVQTPWDLVYLGHHLSRPADDVVVVQPPAGPVPLTHFYCVRAPAFDRMIDFMESTLRDGPMFIDGCYSTMRRTHPDFITLLATPSLGRQRPSSSDLSPKPWDWVPLFRWLADRLRAALDVG